MTEERRWALRDGHSVELRPGAGGTFEIWLDGRLDTTAKQEDAALRYVELIRGGLWRVS